MQIICKVSAFQFALLAVRFWPLVKLKRVPNWSFRFPKFLWIFRCLRLDCSTGLFCIALCLCPVFGIADVMFPWRATPLFGYATGLCQDMFLTQAFCSRCPECVLLVRLFWSEHCYSITAGLASMMNLISPCNPLSLNLSESVPLVSIRYDRNLKGGWRGSGLSRLCWRAGQLKTSFDYDFAGYLGLVREAGLGSVWLNVHD